mgnify:CR=1 FL=1
MEIPCIGARKLLYNKNLDKTLSPGEREPSNPLVLWERVAEGLVRAAGPAFLYGKGCAKV